MDCGLALHDQPRLEPTRAAWEEQQKQNLLQLDLFDLMEQAAADLAAEDALEEAEHQPVGPPAPRTNADAEETHAGGTGAEEARQLKPSCIPRPPLAQGRLMASGSALVVIGKPSRIPVLRRRAGKTERARASRLPRPTKALASLPAPQPPTRTVAQDAKPSRIPVARRSAVPTVAAEPASEEEATLMGAPAQLTDANALELQAGGSETGETGWSQGPRPVPVPGETGFPEEAPVRGLCACCAVRRDTRGPARDLRGRAHEDDD
ncbi:hypothetical protein DFJ74DRAFT_659612 [Hyaloraphidium curvatum]|nr:hypothetical protein DFJ74DRAFT_659612 [Hyaloraphidium curvatum]